MAPTKPHRMNSAIAKAARANSMIRLRDVIDEFHWCEVVVLDPARGLEHHGKLDQQTQWAQM